MGGGGGGGGERNAFQSKTGKNKKINGSSFCIQDNLFLLLFSGLLLLLLLLLFFFFEGPAGTAGLVTQHVYLAFECESTQTRTTASTSA